MFFSIYKAQISIRCSISSTQEEAAMFNYRTRKPVFFFILFELRKRSRDLLHCAANDVI